MPGSRRRDRSGKARPRLSRRELTAQRTRTLPDGTRETETVRTRWGDADD
jgi:hypothetical protein